MKTGILGKNARMKSGAAVQRRKHPRYRSAHPVQMITTTRHVTAIMQDVSMMGARIMVDSPPWVGRDVVVRVDGQDAFGSVVWVDDREAGIAFDSPISMARVLAPGARE